MGMDEMAILFSDEDNRSVFVFLVLGWDRSRPIRGEALRRKP